MTYALIETIPWGEISAPLEAASDAIARLDELLAKNPLRAGFAARTHFFDAAASLWLDGNLVLAEDLVLHDARRDIRTPTRELTQAQTILSARRRIFEAPPGWALTPAGLTSLRGRMLAGQVPDQPEEGRGQPGSAPDGDDRDLADWRYFDDDPLAAELAALDALVERSSKTLNGDFPRTSTGDVQKIVLYDEDWDEETRLAEWRDTVAATQHLPAVLAAALAAVTWTKIEPLQHQAWMGRLLVPALLQARQKTRAHLACFNTGLKLISREHRVSRDPSRALRAAVEALRASAEAGLEDHARWMLAKELLEVKLKGRRGNSKLPRLVDLVLARPLVSSGMIAAELDVTPRAAQDMVRDLGLRELTGRGRYRAWGVF